MMIFLIVTAALVLFVYGFMQQKKFGKLPSGERLERIRKSPQFRDGAFQNINPTPALAEGASYSRVMKQYFFSDKSNTIPSAPLPAIKTDLYSIPLSQNVLVWFGHSSYYLQLDGKRMLVDPIFSPGISPIPGGTKAFKGTNIYNVTDIPDLDYLFITHDHWDHLDYPTVTALKPRIGKTICSLGTGAHLEHWGFAPGSFIEADWHEHFDLGDGFGVTTTPARHFSGRTFKRNQSLWTSYVLRTPSFNIFLGGDSGYDTHFAEIGKQFGPFDLAILENGQYNQSWKYIHMMPEEVVKAATELRAKTLLPVHSAKFSLSLHDWNEPLKAISAASRPADLRLITPRIGERVELNNDRQTFDRWWENL